LPQVESMPTSRAGPSKDYKSIMIKGNIESRFVFSTMLGDDLIPFGYRRIRTVLLPIEPLRGHYRTINEDSARTGGYYHLAQWLEKAESAWRAIRGSKASKYTAVDWLDYRHKLSAQIANARYLVVYPNFQRVSIASAVDTNEILNYAQKKFGLNTSGFIVDYAMYWCACKTAEEASYVAACLNAPRLDELLGNLRRRSQKVHPNVGKKIFDVAAIPRFDENNELHCRISSMGELCNQRICLWIKGNEAAEIGNISNVRREIRKLLVQELAEIDELVGNIFLQM